MKTKPTKPKRKINYAMLKQIMKDIAAEPLRLDMSFPIANDHIAPCGTSACIAGFAVMNNQANKTKKPWETLGPILVSRWQRHGVGWAHWGSVEPTAKRLLGLTTSQANRLFYSQNWPDKFKGYSSHYRNDKRARKAASKIAIKRIAHFIKTRGRE